MINKMLLSVLVISIIWYNPVVAMALDTSSEEEQDTPVMAVDQPSKEKRDTATDSEYIFDFPLSVNTDIYTTNKIAGGGGGKYTDTLAIDFTEGNRITKIEAYKKFYRQKIQVEGIFMTASDGKVVGCGNKVGSKMEFYIEDDEKIIEAEIYGSNFLDGFYLKTSSGREFNVAPADNNGVTYRPPLGSGILRGGMCKSGEIVDSFGFLFLRSVAESRADISYQSIEFDETTAESSIIEQFDFDNTQGNEIHTYKICGTTFTISEYEWEFTDTTSTVDSVKASVPILDTDATGSIKIIYSNVSLHKMAESYAVEQKYKFVLPVQPGEKGYVLVQIYKATVEIPFTLSSTITLDSGVVLPSMEESMEGVFKGEISTKVIAEVTKTYKLFID